MPKGIVFDHAGNMHAVEIEEDSVLSELYEHIGCKVVIPVFVTKGMNVWVDAEGYDNGQKLNEALTKVVDTLGGIDTPLYGPGVFLGCERWGEGEPILDLTRDASESIVMAQVRNAVRQTTNN